jgi:hypothetical protein
MASSSAPIKVRRPAATSVQVNQSKTHFEGPEGTSGPDFMIVPPGSADTEGVYAIFHLGPAASAPFIDGAVHLIWTTNPNVRQVGVGTITGTFTSTQTAVMTAPVSKPATTTAAATTTATAQKNSSPAQATGVGTTAIPSSATQAAAKKPAATPQLAESRDVEDSLRNTASQLTPEQSQAIAKARPPVTPRAGVHELPPGKVQTVSSLSASVQAAQLHAINAGPAVAKNTRDAARMKALCQATKNAPPGLPAETCIKPVPAQSPNK